MAARASRKSLATIMGFTPTKRLMMSTGSGNLDPGVILSYQPRKYFGALTAVLGGFDTVIFTAGIGKHLPSIRWWICEGMEFLGIRLDSLRNEQHGRLFRGTAAWSRFA